MMADTMSLVAFEKELITTLPSYLNSMKGALERYIEDPKIPLGYRWVLWCKAPLCLKNTNEYLFRLKEGIIELNESNRLYDMNLERYRSYDSIEFVEESLVEYFPNHVIDKVKEYVLEHNIGSFLHDW